MSAAAANTATASPAAPVVGKEAATIVFLCSPIADTYPATLYVQRKQKLSKNSYCYCEMIINGPWMDLISSFWWINKGLEGQRGRPPPSVCFGSGILNFKLQLSKEEDKYLSTQTYCLLAVAVVLPCMGWAVSFPELTVATSICKAMGNSCNPCYFLHDFGLYQSYCRTFHYNTFFMHFWG